MKKKRQGKAAVAKPALLIAPALSGRSLHCTQRSKVKDRVGRRWRVRSFELTLRCARPSHHLLFFITSPTLFWLTTTSFQSPSSGSSSRNAVNMSEVYETPEWLSVSYPFGLLNDTVDRNRDWYYEQASKATKGLSFPELRIASRYALSMSLRLYQTGSKATEAELKSYWMGVARQVNNRRKTEAQASLEPLSANQALKFTAHFASQVPNGRSQPDGLQEFFGHTHKYRAEGKAC